MKKYNHKEIEKKWQKFWDQNQIYTAPDSAPDKDNFYLLVEFPYPSGNLHVGHWYAFAVPDVLARMLRMQGKNVMYPIGFDAFGLPAENAAIKNKVNPRDWTLSNIDYMTKQIRSMGTSFDWTRKVVACDPDYYKWTQWLFLQLYKKGLAYQKETAVNWCPKDKTVLANEQVISGRCERCDSEVIQKQMLQWNIKITDYADRLIDDLGALDWPEQIKESQRNWIGRSEGAEIDFPLEMGKKYTYVLLHGFRALAEDPHLQYLRDGLEKMGHTVIVPQLPNPDAPVESEQVAAALAATTYDENTVVFGHSLGTVVAMKVLEKLDKPIARLVLAGGFIKPEFKDRPRNFEKTFSWTFDAAKIRTNAKSITILHDPRDYAITDAQRSDLETLLGTKAQICASDKPHFCGEREFDVLMWLRPTIRVFTTRPDTLYGATYMVLAPEHPWVTLALQHKTVLTNNDEVQVYVTAAGKKTELERQQETKEKTGVLLGGVSAVNPATGEKIPLYVADYVLGHYGTGAIMAVPAHDERDYAFAQKFGIPVKQVIMPVFGTENRRDGAVHRETISAFVRRKDDKILMLQWPEFKWTTGVLGGIEKGETAGQAAVREVLEETGYKAKCVFESPFSIESHFYADHKKEWRSRMDHPVLLELIDDAPAAVTPEESAKHSSMWMDIDEAISSSSFGNNKLALEMAVGRVSAYVEPRYGEIQEIANSEGYNGMEALAAKKTMTEAFGRAKKTYRLRDWIVSRQRYWGAPIPIIHCAKCGPVAVPDEQLPVVLPDVEDYLPSGEGKSPLAKVSSFLNTKCPTCGSDAQRETDTLDTFVDSSWYFLRYSDPKNPAQFASKEKMDAWMPIDLYSGGAEHTTMHVLYSRFWQKALFDCGLVKDAEPYTRRMNRSIILGPDGQKMSKSRGNVVDPDAVVEQLGADTVRMYLAFIGPYNEVASYPWNPDGVVGVRRFLERFAAVSEIVQDATVNSLEPVLHKTIQKVGQDIAALKLNTAISQMMILLNAVEKEKHFGKTQWETFLKILAPFAPHLTEELWHESGHEDSIHIQSWPKYDEKLLSSQDVTIAVQMNGKARATITITADADKEATEKAAREALADRLASVKVLRTIVVPGRIVNFVVSE